MQETKSVNAVEDALIETGYLDPYISKKEKKPSWDGDVIIYNKRDKRKDHIVGRVDVQVKGEVNDDLDSKITKYDVDVDDLKNYVNMGGVIYFVVHISSNYKTKIYYQTLTPVKLYTILDSCHIEQKTKSVEFVEFPVDHKKRIDIFLNFFNDSSKQRSYKKDDMISVEEIQKSNIPLQLTGSISSIGDDRERAFLENEMYLYYKNGKALIPVIAVPQSVEISNTINVNISINGHRFYDRVVIISKREGTFVRIGRSFTFPMTDEQPSQFNIKICGELYNRIIDLDFLINLIKYGGYEIEGHGKNTLDLSSSQIVIDLDSWLRELNYLEKIRDTFKRLNIKKTIDLTKLTAEEHRSLDLLVAAFYDDKVIPKWKTEQPDIGRIAIQDISILVGLKRIENLTYKLYDPFDPPLTYVPLTSTIEEQHPLVPIYAVLTLNDYIKIDNIKYKLIVSAYDNLKQSGDLSVISNRNMLTLLNSYDTTGNIEQLDAAEMLLEWSNISYNETDKNVYLLNKLQILKRRRELTPDEKGALLHVIENGGVDEGILAGAYLLLDNMDAAEIHVNKMSNEMRVQFIEFPIYKKFWQGK